MQTMSWRRETWPSGAIIFQEGDIGRDAYLIEKGRVNICRTNEQGKNIVLRVLEEGEIFGEIALIDNQPRTASAVAATETVLIPINNKLFFDKLNHTDPLLAHLLGLVVSRFRVSNSGQSPHTDNAIAGHMTALHDYAVSNIRSSQDMSESIDRGEFVVYFQPVTHMSDRSLAGFEALVRWNKPGAKIVGPSEFISLAEDTGLIVPLGRMITSKALDGLKFLQATMNAQHPGKEQLFISINLSARQLFEPGELDVLLDIVKQSNVPSHQVKMEITESMMMGNVEEAIQSMHRIKQAGLLLAIDDFGTGYSSLSYLEQMPLDNLKIDRSFVLAMRRKESGQRIARAITALAHELGMDCIAEGVEDAIDEQALKKMGCRYGQGYFYAKPLALDDALGYVSRFGAGKPASISG